MKTIILSVVLIMIFSALTGLQKYSLLYSSKITGENQYKTADMQRDPIYAYDQKIVGGKQAFTVDSNGNSKTVGANVNTRYFIFLQVPNGSEVNITELCIGGKPYYFSTEAVTTPAVLKRQFPGEQKYDTLVPATTQKVFRIINNNIRTDKKGTKSSRGYLVVLKYQMNGKNITAHTNEIKHLPEVLMQ